VNPWLIVGFLVALALVGSGGFLYGKDVGQTAEHDQWMTREAKLNADAAAKIKEQADKVLALEHAKSEELNLVATDYEAQLKEKDRALSVALNTIKSGGLFIRAACPAPNRDNVPGATASPGIGNGAQDFRLPDSYASDLLTLAAECDRNTLQLGAAQAVIRADRTASKP